MDDSNKPKYLHPLVTQSFTTLETEVTRLVNRIDYIIEGYDYERHTKEETGRNLERSFLEDLLKELNSLKDSSKHLFQRVTQLETSYSNQIELLRRELERTKTAIWNNYPTFDDLGGYIKTEDLIALTERIVLLESRLDIGEF